MIDSNNESTTQRPQKMRHFLEVSLLLLLFRSQSHGYELAEKLSEFGFKEDDLKISTVYRALRKMEDKDLVVSSWSSNYGARAKRIYKISDAGKMHLTQWIDILKFRKSQIETLIDAYDHVQSEN